MSIKSSNDNWINRMQTQNLLKRKQISKAQMTTNVPMYVTLYPPNLQVSLQKNIVVEIKYTRPIPVSINRNNNQIYVYIYSKFHIHENSCWLKSNFEKAFLVREQNKKGSRVTNCSLPFLYVCSPTQLFAIPCRSWNLHISKSRLATVLPLSYRSLFNTQSCW